MASPSGAGDTTPLPTRRTSAGRVGPDRRHRNPALTTLRYFEDEYRAHLDGICPAGVCRPLIEFSIVEKDCPGCGACIRACATEAITGEKKKPHKINQDLCIQCGACKEVCKFD